MIKSPVWQFVQWETHRRGCEPFHPHLVVCDCGLGEAQYYNCFREAVCLTRASPPGIGWILTRVCLYPGILLRPQGYLCRNRAVPFGAVAPGKTTNCPFPVSVLCFSPVIPCFEFLPDSVGTDDLGLWLAWLRANSFR